MRKYHELLIHGMATTPTARTLQYCRKQNWVADVAEKWIAVTRQRKDLFGFIDIVVLSKDKTIGIQATTTSHQQNRVKKIIKDCRINAIAWLEAGNAIEVWGWGKRKLKRGSEVYRWYVTRTEITLEDFIE